MRPGCSSQRPTRVSLSASGLVSQFQPLSICGKYHAVIANHIAATQSGETDNATFARAGDAITTALSR